MPKGYLRLMSVFACLKLCMAFVLGAPPGEARAAAGAEGVWHVARRECHTSCCLAMQSTSPPSFPQTSNSKAALTLSLLIKSLAATATATSTAAAVSLSSCAACGDCVCNVRGIFP